MSVSEPCGRLSRNKVIHATVLKKRSYNGQSITVRKVSLYDFRFYFSPSFAARSAPRNGSGVTIKSTPRDPHRAFPLTESNPCEQAGKIQLEYLFLISAFQLDPRLDRSWLSEWRREMLRHQNTKRPPSNKLDLWYVAKAIALPLGGLL